jgi:transposase-like protein
MFAIFHFLCHLCRILVRSCDSLVGFHTFFWRFCLFRLLTRVRVCSAAMMSIESFMPGEEECISTLREMRWPGGVVVCPRCRSDTVVKDGLIGLYQMYWYKRCNFGFDDRSRTIFRNTKVPLREWFMMVFMIQFKVLVLEISKTIKVSYRHAYCMARKIRERLREACGSEAQGHRRDRRTLRHRRP